MTQNTLPLLLALVRATLCNRPLTESERAAVTEDELPALYALANKHDIANLVGMGISQSGLSFPASEAARRIGGETAKALYRYERLRYELDTLCAALEAAEIPFIPLKGSILRDYYPAPWMRTSCDIDVLVHVEDVTRAGDVLVMSCDYKCMGKGSHDVPFSTPSGNHIELHYDLIEESIDADSRRVLSGIWEDVTPAPGATYRSVMSDAMFYFYHIAHMAKHFQNGGCGMRPFFDLWILDRLEGVDHASRDALLAAGGLLRFAEAARSLSRVWLDGNEPDDRTEQMKAYILSGGVYGTQKNRVAVQQQRKGGKLRYLCSKVFIPYEVIKFQYPVLERHRWLTPAMEVRRWWKLLIHPADRRRSVNEIKYNTGVSDSEAADIRAFLSDIGL